MNPKEVKDLVLKAFWFRHACKDFDPERKIPEEDFEFILEAARLSPSSFGFEPWVFLVVQDSGLRRRLLDFTWGGEQQIPTCSHLVVCLARREFFMRYDSDYIDYMMREVQKLPPELRELKRQKYREFQEEDFRLLENERALFDWACKQTYIAMANMMTATAMIGIDSCPMEGFNPEKVNQVLRDNFGIDIEKMAVAYMVAFGYRRKEPRPKTRQTLERIVRWY
ncbi:NAD(P)H-dependent oxidoreductase [Thermosulfuriphilus sp.]